MKKIKNFLCRVTTILLILVIGGAISTSIIKNKTTEEDVAILADAWSSSLAESVKFNDPSTARYINIDTLYNVSNNVMTAVNPNGLVDNNTIIKINNGLDLYYFSELCNDELYGNNYLSYHYVLGQNIDYTDASRTFKLIKPIGWSGTPFSGTFDGQGFTITDLFFYHIQDETDFTNIFYNVNNDSFLEYMALFSVNTGEIKNIGFINSNNIQSTDTFGEFVFITTSIVVGQNRGLIDHVFVQDLRGDNAGITVEGSSTLTSPLAGFNFPVNNGDVATISNCYVAVNYISSTSVILSDESRMYPAVINNENLTDSQSGTITSVYYDEDIILHDTHNNIDEVIGLHTSDFQDLTIFNNELGWYSNATYNTNMGTNSFSTYLQLKYPSLLGFNTRDYNGKKNFVINSTAKFIYFSEVIKFSPFRTASYLITETINMDHVAPESFALTNNIFQGTIDGSVRDNPDASKIIFANGTTSTNSSIINFKLTKGISYNGYHNYGLFGALGGQIKNLNIFNAEIKPLDLVNSTSSSFNEITSIGILCGTLINGTIDNVHVNGSITLNNGSANNYMGTTYVGGITGYSSSGSISNSTSNGEIVGSLQSVTNNLSDVAIGGIIGYNDACEKIANCLSAMDIEAIRYRTSTSIKQYLGGVIGYAKSKSSYELQNNGNIYVGVTLTNPTYNSATAYYYGNVFVGGIIGLIQQARVTNGSYYNNGDIYYYVNDNNYRVYISGAFNAISEIAMQYNILTSTESYQSIQDKIDSASEFDFVSVASGGTLYIENKLSTSKQTAKLYQADTSITNGIDIRAAGLVYSYLTKIDFVGLYTLNYKTEYNYICQNAGTYSGQNYARNQVINKTTYLALTPSEALNFIQNEIVETSTGAQEIDVSMMDEYAPCVSADNQVTFINNKLYVETNQIPQESDVFNVNDNKLETTINVNRGYNFRDVNYFTTMEPLFYTLQLSGNLNGRNFNVNNLRNDGDISIYFSMPVTNTAMNVYKSYYGDTKKIKVFGCLEEINIDHRATNVYNGGDITISSATTDDNIIPVIYSIYAAGICYKNVGNDNSITGEGLMLSSGYVGSLHNSVNNGNIRITNSDNGAGCFYGQSRIGGITCFNCSTISSCYNLGNITNVNNIQAVQTEYGGTGTSDQFEVESGGFCFIMQNDPLTTDGSSYTRANIIDSANNGTIISATPSTNGWVNASGFVVRNERCESGPTIDHGGQPSLLNINSQEQKIENCINYGDIYAYNPRTTHSATEDSEPDCKAAGFICLGVSTIIDVINYGKIYSNKVAGGMYGYVFFSRMIDGTNIESGNPVYIANAINYGEISIFTQTTTNLNLLLNNRHNEIQKDTAASITQYPVGALIGMACSKDESNYPYSVVLGCLNIKNLVNFYDSVNMVGRTAAMRVSNNPADYIAMFKTMQYMATTKDADTCPNAPFSTFTINTSQTYGNVTIPAGTYGIKAYSKDTASGNPAVANNLSKAYNGGIFNTNYTLRTAPPLVDVNGSVVTDMALADPNNTDNYIADYIQFVPYSKVNEYLVNKINLSGTIYQNAIDNLLNDVDMLDQILSAYLADLDDTTNPTISSIYTAVLSHSSFTTAKNATFNEPYETLYDLLQSIYQNHPNDEALYQVLLNLLNNTDNTINSLFGSNEALYQIIDDVLLNVNETNSIYNELITTLINNDAYLNSYIEYVGYENILTLMNDYLTSLNTTDINNLFDTFTNNTYINVIIQDILANTPQNEHNVLFSTLLDGVDPTIITELYNLLEHTSDGYINSIISNLTEIELNNTLSYYLTNAASSVTDNDVNTGKSGEEGYNLTPASIREILIQYYLDPDNQDALTDLFTGLTSEALLTENEKVAYFNYLYSLANSTADDNDDYKNLFNNLMTSLESGGYVYIKSDSKSYNSSEVTGGGMIIDGLRKSAVITGTTTSYIYTGQYFNSSGRLASAEYSTEKSYLMSYTANKSTGILFWITYNFYISHNTEENINNKPTFTRATSGTGSAPYFTIAQNDDSYVFFNAVSSNEYRYLGYGQYVRLIEQTNYNVVDLLNTIEDTTKYELINRMFANLNNLSIDKQVFIKSLLDFVSQYSVTNLNINTLYQNIYLDKSLLETSLESAPLVFDIEEKKKILYVLANTNLDSKNYILDTYFDSDEKNAITIQAYNDASYYKTVIETISNELTSNQKYAFIEHAVHYSPHAGTYIILDIINNYSASEKKQVVMGTGSYNKEYLIEILTDLHDNSLLENSDIQLFLNAICNNDHLKVQTIIDYMSANNLLNVADKKILINEYAIHNITLYKYILNNYFGINLDSNDPETQLTNITNNTGIDLSNLTDSVGIYALASSYGIKNGMFIPDNLSLIGLDPYSTIDGNLVNDPTWRGGSSSQPNHYDETNPNTVNYKVYYMMKQLKRSISTVVFKIELVDNIGNPIYTVNNNIEDDYDLENFVIDFYIPSNADELKEDYLYINTDSSKIELAYRASLYDSHGIFIDGSNHTYVKGDTITDTFIVQAEDTNVKQTYTLRINVTAPKSISNINEIQINGITNLIQNTHYTNSSNNVLLTYNNNVSPYVLAENGSIRLEYSTYNYQDGLNLASSLKMYHYNGETYPTSFNNIMASTTIVDPSLYRLTNTTNNNGIVVMENNAYYCIEPGDYYGSWVVNENGTLRQAVGTLIFDVHTENTLPYGTYILEFTVNENTKYLTVFQKQANPNANVLSVSYETSEYINTTSTNNNQTNPLLVPYGYPLTRAILESFDNYGEYQEDSMYEVIITALDTIFNIQISPLAQGYVVGTPTHSRDGNYITYVLPITITSESGNTNTFNLYIREDNITGDLLTVYENGRIINDETTTTDNGLTTYFDYHFVKYDTPSYTFEYDMTNFHFLENSTYMSLSLVNSEEIINNLSRSNLERINEVAFSGLTEVEINALSNNAKLDLQINALKEISFVLSTIEGSSVTVSFTENAPSTTYQFVVSYDNSNDFEENDTINWSYPLEGIIITKEKNTDSYLESIAFTSDSVVTSLDTIASPTEVAVFMEGTTNVAGYVDYQTLVRNANNEREIICLPSRIFYNEYTADVNKQDIIYMIGLVDKTAISEYSPVFKLPEDSEIYLLTNVNNTQYKNVMYNYETTVDGNIVTSSIVFLVNETDTEIRMIDENNTIITPTTTTNGLDTFTYNGTTYTKSIYSGEYNTLNLGLYYDFSVMTEESSTAGIQEFFNYANYRVYSEAYDSTNVNVDHYTDFMIAVQDISNNVLINVFIELDPNMASIDVNLFNNSLSSNYLYLLLTNFLSTEAQPNNYDQFNNMMGSFVSYDNVNDEFVISKFRTNTSGRYQIDFELPEGYSFTFVAKKKNITIDSGNADESMIVGNMITSQIIDLYITIIKESEVTDDWGRHFETLPVTEPVI